MLSEDVEFAQAFYTGLCLCLNLLGHSLSLHPRILDSGVSQEGKMHFQEVDPDSWQILKCHHVLHEKPLADQPPGQCVADPDGEKCKWDKKKCLLLDVKGFEIFSSGERSVLGQDFQAEVCVTLVHVTN